MTRSRLYRREVALKHQPGLSAEPDPAWFSDFRNQLNLLPSWKRNLACWGVLIISMQVLVWLAPSGTEQAGLLAFATSIFGAVFVLIYGIRSVEIVPRVYPFIVVLIMQLWSIFTSFYASRYLGRTIRLGRPETYLVDDLIPGLVAYGVCSIAPNMRRILKGVVVAALAASSAVAWLQFARFPPALALARVYTYKAIDNWDGHPGIRAVGLSGQPNHLGFEAVIGLSLVCAGLMDRPLTRRQFAFGFLFAGAAFFTQSRAAIIPLIVVCIAILVGVARFDRRLVMKILFGLALVALVSIPIAAKRFQYLMMTTSGNDASYSARENVAWAQVEPILPRLPLTGIGPSSGLFNGSGPEDKWVPVGRPVESGYLLFQAMYGIPGVVILVCGLLGSAILAFLGIRKSRDPLQRQLLAVGIVCCSALAINASTFDTFDTYIHLPLALIIAGLAAVSKEGVTKTWSMRKQVTPQGAHPQELVPAQPA
jgi:hypothetical protein